MTSAAWVSTLAAVAPLFYVASELIARWWIRRRRHYYVLPPGLRLRLHIDREVLPQMEPETRLDVNRDGERGDDVPHSTDGLYRVLVGGGSQPEGFFLDQDTTWPGALQRLLQGSEQRRWLGASRVHVGSVARSGVGAEALDIIFDRILPRYPRLQLIVILIGATDVLRWLEEGAPRSPVRVRPEDIFRCHPDGQFGWLPPELAAMELLRRARLRWLRPIQVHERAGKWIGRARAMRARAKTVRTTVPDPAPMLEHFEFHFRKVLVKASAHADRVLVVRQPWFDKEFSADESAHMWHGGVGQVWREEVTTFYSFDVVSGLMALVDAKAASAARAHGVEQLDLMPLLDRSLATYYDGFHLTPAGAKAVAGAVAAAILRQPHTTVYTATAREDQLPAA